MRVLVLSFAIWGSKKPKFGAVWQTGIGGGGGIMHSRFSNTIPRACGKWEHGIQSIILELGWWVWKPSLWMEFEGFVEITGGVVRRQLVDAY